MTLRKRRSIEHGTIKEPTADLWLVLFREKERLQREKEQLENPIFSSFPSSEIARKDEQIRDLDKRMARLEGMETQENKTFTKSNALVWLGSKVEFAAAIVGFYEKGQIQANSATDALKQAALHFVDKDGKALNPKSLWQNLRNKEDFSKRKL